jgi:hypothetical protein
MTFYRNFIKQRTSLVEYKVEECGAAEISPETSGLDCASIWTEMTPDLPVVRGGSLRSVRYWTFER